MKPIEISFKDLTKGQLTLLKDIYIDSRVNGMSEEDLRQFARDVIDLQVRGTVGNEEEREIWKEMKEHFDQDFEKTIKEVIKANKVADITIDSEQEDFKKRLELLEQRKKDEDKKKEDMWDDD